MPTTIISNRHGTGNVQSERLIVDMAEQIAYLEPDATPLTVVLKRALGKSEATHNAKFSALEAPIQPRWDAVNNAGGYSAIATTITVDNGSYFAIDDLVKIPSSGEIVLVTGVSGNDLEVTRSYGTTAAATMDNDEPLLIIGNSHDEGSTIGNIRTIQLEVFFNYTRHLGASRRNPGMKSCLNAGTPLELQLLIAEMEVIANSKNVEDSAISRKGYLGSL